MEPCVLSHMDNYWFGVRSNGQILIQCIKDFDFTIVRDVNKAVLAQW